MREVKNDIRIKGLYVHDNNGKKGIVSKKRRAIAFNTISRNQRRNG